MAQTTQPAKSSAPPTPASNGASAKNSAKPANPTTSATRSNASGVASSPYGDAPQPTLMQRLPAMGQSVLGMLRGPRTNAPASSTNGKPGATSATQGMRGTGKFVMGLIVFMLGAELLLYGLTYADSALHLGLQGTVFPVKSVPQMSWLNWFQLIYFAAILVFWIVLLRFNIIPRDPFGAKAQAQARAASGRGGATGANGKKATPAEQIPGIGIHKPRAARRREVATATATAATKVESRPASGWRSLLPSGLRSTKARSAGSQTAAPTTTAAQVAKAAPGKVAPSRVAASVAPVSGHDAAYERVKAAQRQQRRRSAKR